MSDNEPEKGKKKFKMPNTYVILFGVICFIAVLSWFVPGGAYELNANGDAISGTYHIVESNPQGLWDVFMAPITGMLGSGAISGAIAISLTILLFGSFLEMMEETGAVKTALKRITMKNQNNMHLLIAILVCLMSFLGTLEGAYEEGIVYFLMFVPVILALGLDTVVAIMIVVLGTQAGCLASTVNHGHRVGHRRHLGRRRHGHARADAGGVHGTRHLHHQPLRRQGEGSSREVGPVLPSQARSYRVPGLG